MRLFVCVSSSVCVCERVSVMCICICACVCSCVYVSACLQVRVRGFLVCECVTVLLGAGRFGKVSVVFMKKAALTHLNSSSEYI